MSVSPIALDAVRRFKSSVINGRCADERRAVSQESAQCEGDKALLRSGRPLAEPFPGVSIAGIGRRVTHLPLSGRIVQLLVIAPRFRCDAVLCGRQIFKERFTELHRRSTGSIGATYGEDGCDRPGPWSGALRSNDGRLRKTADAARE